MSSIAIVAHIDRETVKLDEHACTATERTIALLKERRAALIAAAVSGQLDLVMCTHDLITRLNLRQPTESI